MSKKGRSKGEKPEMEMDPVQMVINNYLDFAGYKASVATTQLCCFGTKATIGNM